MAAPFPRKTEKECKTGFDKWIYVLTHMEALTRMPFTAQKKIFEKLAEYADKHHLNAKEHEQYENSLWIARDNLACMEAAEQEAKERGFSQGLAEGMEKGMEKGIAKNKIATAKRLLAMGLTPEQVAQGSELPLDEVLKLSQGD